MMHFRALDLAIIFHRAAKDAPLTGDIKDQLVRASSSVCLNLAEGRGRRTRKDQVKHFHYALGSIRESQAVLVIEDLVDSDLWIKADKTAASVYKLIKNAR